MPRVDSTVSRADGLAMLAWEAGLDDWIVAIAWSSDGQWLAAASVSGPIHVYDVATGRLHRSWHGHDLGTMSISWSVDGGLLASGGQDGAVRLWSPDREVQLFEMEGGAAWVEHVAFDPMSALLATAAGRVLRLWSTEGERVRSYPLHGSTISDIAWRPATRTAAGSAPRLISAAYGGIALWSVDTDAPLERLDWIGSILRVAWSPDGRFIATGDQDSTVHFWIVDRRRDLQMWGYPRKVTALAWDAASRFLATNGSEQVTVWDCSGRGPEGSEPRVLADHETPVTALAFQRRGPRLVSGDDDGRAVLWEPARQRRPLWRARFGGEVSCVAWSPIDDAFAAGYGSGAVRVFRVGSA